MLKLMKYEMIHSMRTFMAAFLAFLAGCVIMPIVIKMFAGNNVGEIIIGLLGFMFIVLTVGISMALFVSIFKNFNQSVFDRPGYLTLTLPKSNLEILISKLVVAMIWVLIGMFVLFGGIMLMMVFAGGIDIFALFEKVIYALKELFNFYGYQIIMYILNAIIDLCLIVSIIYFSITITHTKWIRRYRMILSVVLFFALNLAIEAGVDAIFLTGSDITSYSNMILTLIYGGLSVGFIFMTSYIMNHHIEVE